jgi:hypothetical protein
MPEETRVFDVSKPGQGSPQATSKPVIVGHHPATSDPMVRDDGWPEPTRIAVHDSGHDEPKSEPQTIGDTALGGADLPVFSAPDATEKMPEEPPEPEAPNHEPAINPVFPSSEPAPELGEVKPLEPLGPVEGLHVSPPKKRLGPLGWIILILLAFVIAGYLLIDSGAIKTSLNLPFHVFKQKTPATTPPPAPSPSPGSTLPTGFTEYKLAGTTITFDAPTAWGTPTSTTDPGYSARGGTNKSDGTHAYLVNFATNKDVEIAVTSSQFLPVARGALYYDYQQWCTGTADGKIYIGLLHSTTSADKIDKPSTVTCDQGPLMDATKLDSTTIVQLKTKDASGAVIGDLYTKNLGNADLPVLRVKDAKSANATDIKKLLATVKAPASASSSTSSQ